MADFVKHDLVHRSIWEVRPFACDHQEWAYRERHFLWGGHSLGRTSRVLKAKLLRDYAIEQAHPTICGRGFQLPESTGPEIQSPLAPISSNHVAEIPASWTLRRPRALNEGNLKGAIDSRQALVGEGLNVVV